MIITAAQLRAARGLLDWTRTDLAKAANISPETVKNIEHGTFRPQEQTADAIVRAFGAHNVEFTEDEGVRRRKDSVTKYEGIEGFRKFMDDVYEAAKDLAASSAGEKPICVSNVDDRLFLKYLGDYADIHGNRMNKLKDVKVKVLAGDKGFFQAPNSSHIEYRWNLKQDTVNVPFYVYGDKLAIISFDVDAPPQVIVIASAMVAKAYREQFDVLWRNAKSSDRIQKAN